MRLLSLTIFALFLAVDTASAQQFANGNCLYPARAAATNFRWWSYPHLPGELYLYRGNEQLGAYYKDSGLYRPLLDASRGVWGEDSDPPAALPAGYVFKHVEPALNFGIERNKLLQRAEPDESYKLTTPQGTRDVSKEEAQNLVTKTIPDDAKKLRLTVIGTKAERAPVLIDLGLAENADLRDKVNVWDVEPTHWSLRDNVTGKAMYMTGGHPTVYLQAPNGKVLHRQDGYQPGDVSAIRKLVASYDPSKDPDVRNPLSLDLTGPLPLLAGGFLGIGALLLVSRRRLI